MMSNEKCQASPVMNVEEEEDKPLSKRKQKKLIKKQKWDEHRAERRAKERANVKKRRKEARERGESLGPSRKRLKDNTMATSTCKLRVVIDASLHSYMSDKDLGKMVKQLGHSYAVNRRATNPMQFYVTGIEERMRQRLAQYNKDYAKWDVHFEEKDYLDLFAQENVVYLSSDSDNVATTLEHDKVYIIGGLVDHNAHKGLCHQLAVDKGVAHAQLPIGQYLNMTARKVLTVNHVFEILLKYSESGDWKSALLSVIPERKGATPKQDNDTNAANQDTPGTPGAANQTTESISAPKLDIESTPVNDILHENYNDLANDHDSDADNEKTGEQVTIHKHDGVQDNSKSVCDVQNQEQTPDQTDGVSQKSDKCKLDTEFDRNQQSKQFAFKSTDNSSTEICSGTDCQAQDGGEQFDEPDKTR